MGVGFLKRFGTYSFARHWFTPLNLILSRVETTKTAGLHVVKGQMVTLGETEIGVIAFPSRHLPCVAVQFLPR